MKKTVCSLIVIIAVTLTSCSSGWSCQKRYCKAPTKVKISKTAPHQVNA